jgi:hypothetical protein
MLSTLAPVPAVSAPTRLRLPDLLRATDHAADEVLSGRYDRLLRRLPKDDRWYTRLSGDDEIEVWLISWVPDKSLGRRAFTEATLHGRRPGGIPFGVGA